MSDDDFLLVPPDPFTPPRPARDHSVDANKMVLPTDPPPDPPRREAKLAYTRPRPASKRR